MDYRDSDLHYVVDCMRTHGAPVKIISEGIGADEDELKSYFRDYVIRIEGWQFISIFFAGITMATCQIHQTKKKHYAQ